MTGGIIFYNYSFKDGERFDPINNKNHFTICAKIDKENGLQMSLTRDYLISG